MARVTVEDCVTVVPNRFELCLIASNRAKSILSGAATELNNKEKPSVIALREVAEKSVDIDHVRQNIARDIKNRGIINYEELVAEGIIVKESTAGDEMEDKEMVLQDNTFVEENIEVDD